MSAPHGRDFPNIERLLLFGVYAPLVGGVTHVGSFTPDNLEEVLPFLRVVRMGGARGQHFDYPSVDVSYFALDEATGSPAASMLANVVMTKPYPHPALDSVDCTIAPREVGWRNPDVRHWSWTYEIQTRRVREPFLP